MNSRFAKLFVFLTVALLFSHSQNIYAASITVNASCSLSDAITAANTDTATGGCAAGSGADTIALTSNITSSDLPVVTNTTLPSLTTITIEGNGYTIDAADTSFVVDVRSGSGLTINNLTVTNRPITSNTRGLFYLSHDGASLTVNNSTFKNNTATVVSSNSDNGSLTIDNSIFQNNQTAYPVNIFDAFAATISNSTFKNNTGGAIRNAGTITIINTVFENNSNTRWSHANGAILHYSGSMTINDSTFRNNGKAGDFTGRAIYSSNATLTVANSISKSNSAGIGGAIYKLNTFNRSLSIKSSYFSGNSAAIGGAVFIGDTPSTPVIRITIENNTFNGNSATQSGGAIYLGSALTDIDGSHSIVSHNTIYKNTAATGGGVYDSSSRFYLLNNIIADNTGGDCHSSGFYRNAGNLIQDGSCSPTHSGDPRLGTLVEPTNGSSAYYPLLTDSPAINAADADYCASTDQVGTSRPQGDTCDIGAYELLASSVLTATSTLQPSPTTTATETPTDAPTATSTVTLTPTPECAGTSTEAPGAPTDLLGSFSIDGITISWTAPEGGADGYEVSRHVHYLPGSEVVETGGIAAFGYGSTAHTATTFFDTAVVQQPDHMAEANYVDPAVTTRDHDRYAIYYEKAAYYRYRVAAIRLDANCDPLKGSYSDWVRVDSPAAPPSETPTATDTPTAESSPWTCVNVGTGEYWLFFEDKFLSGLTTVYPGSSCQVLEITQDDIGDDGFVYTPAGQAAAEELCEAGHDDGLTYSAQQSAFNSDVWECTLAPTATDTSEQTADDPVPSSEAITVWSADMSVVDYGTGAIGAGSANLLSNQGGSDGLEAVWLWYYAPDRELYLTFSTAIDATGLTLHAGGLTVALPEEASGQSNITLQDVDVDWTGGETIEVRLVRGETASVQAATDTPEPTATDTPEPTATDTPEPTATDAPELTDTPEPTATDTLVPPSETPIPTNTPVPPTNTPVPPTNTPVPPTATDTPVPANAKVVSNVTLQSNQAGVLEVSWDAPSAAPKDYRISWSLIGEKFPTLDRPQRQCLPNQPLVHDQRLGRRRPLQGAIASPL